MKVNVFSTMIVVMALTLSVTIAAYGQQEKVPSQRGRTSDVKKSRNCQLNSMEVTPSSFREDERITVEVVVVCNQPVDKAYVLVQHVLGNRGHGLSQKFIAFTSGRNVVQLRVRAGRAGRYRVRMNVADGSLRGTLRTAPVAWVAPKVIFH